MRKRIISALLCAILLLGMGLPAYAEEVEELEAPVVTKLRIATEADFLEFAERCRLDTYSRNLSVRLEKDLDLSGSAFTSIPIFSGSFDGQGHTISGLTITADGSMQGLFRYLTATAVVQNLTVQGDIHPGGSRSEVGTFAGRNEGRLFNCSFTGTVSGGDYVGGIVGTNGVTGLIEGCHVEGKLYGDHFVGGIAGENAGVIRNCTNKALVNTTPQENSVEIGDITMDTLTNTESANTVTDIGGIAGISSGVIRSCGNQGDVGYRHMGYNIGGIAGTQSGYIVDCTNGGDIQGRKEVGGIVGQMEPAFLIEYTEDTLQILRGQLGTMSGLVNRASSNVQSNASRINGQIGVLQDQTQTARNAVEMLLPSGEDLQLPDDDTVLAAQSTLSATLNDMPGTLYGIASATQTTVYSLTRDLNAISSQISAMGDTINNAGENLGGSITDVSDQDTEDTLSGKVERCLSFGNVLADYNAGGISGAIAMENDLDILEDWNQNGEESLNFESEVRAVILNSENYGSVTGKKQNIGGIVGLQSLGMVKKSFNTGTVDGTAADYVGGVSGFSAGFIREDYAKCEIYGNTYVGGIAGSGTIVTDSLAQVRLVDAKEKLGAILGFAEENHSEEETPISGNFYFSVDKDWGAIDGISYSALAEPLDMDAFLALEGLPRIFQTVTVRFVYEDGTIHYQSVEPGGELSTSQIPAIPEKEGYTADWEGLDTADLSNVLFDMNFEAVYTPYRTAIQSEAVRENGLPVLLLEGTFGKNAVAEAEESELAPVLTEKETLLEAWTIHAGEGAETVRFLLPKGAEADQVKLMLSKDASQWRQAEVTTDGSYLVFALEDGENQLALVQESGNPMMVWLLGGAAGLLLLAGILLWRKKAGRKQKDTASETKESK